eukprot:PhF_6_TR38593/c1_g1_i2/m.57398
MVVKPQLYWGLSPVLLDLRSGQCNSHTGEGFRLDYSSACVLGGQLLQKECGAVSKLLPQCSRIPKLSKGSLFGFHVACSGSRTTHTSLSYVQHPTELLRSRLSSVYVQITPIHR